MKRWTRFTILCVSALLLLLPKKIAIACGGGVEGGDYRFWILQPDISGDADLEPFYFSSMRLFNNDIDAGADPHKEQNIKEWYAALGGKAKTEDIDAFLYRTAPASFLPDPASYDTANSMLEVARRARIQDTWRYLVLSKKVETICFLPDPWGDNRPGKGIEAVIADMQRFYDYTSNRFLKQRAAYQLQKLHDYYGNPQEVVRIYDSLLAPLQPTGFIAAAGLYQKALNITGPGQPYLFARVFDMGMYNRRYCAFKFGSEGLTEALPYAKNRHERNVMTALHAMNFKGRALPFLQEIHASEPRFRDLPFLLLREINKVEDWLWTTKLTHFNEPATTHADDAYDAGYAQNAAANRRSDEAYAVTLYAFTKKIIGTAAANDAPLLQLYAAHLSMLLGNTDEASLHLRGAALTKDPKLKLQVRINSLLLQFDRNPGSAAEEELAAIIKTPDRALQLSGAGTMKHQLILYAARKMISRGDKVRGMMLLCQTERALGNDFGWYGNGLDYIEDHATPADYDQMLALLAKEHKTSFEKIITTNRPAPLLMEDSTGIVWDPQQVLNLKASSQVRARDLRGAAKTLAAINPWFYQEYPYNLYLDGDPFYLNIYTSHRRTVADRRRLSKIQTIREMVRLDSLASAHPAHAALYYYQLGNAWYNLGYWGKYWLVVRRGWSVSEGDFNKDMQLPAYYDDYYGNLQAMDYYRKAAAAANDQRLRALAFFMADHCLEQFRSYRASITGKRQDVGAVHRSFRELQKAKVDSAYYRELVEECALYASFISTYNRVL